jgi:hypothetical protein
VGAKIKTIVTQKLETSLSPRVVIGLMLIAVGVLVPLVFILWYSHVRWVLVDKSVPLVPGRVEVEFSPNFEGSMSPASEFNESFHLKPCSVCWVKRITFLCSNAKTYLQYSSSNGS